MEDLSSAHVLKNILWCWNKYLGVLITIFLIGSPRDMQLKDVEKIWNTSCICASSLHLMKILKGHFLNFKTFLDNLGGHLLS